MVPPLWANWAILPIYILLDYINFLNGWETGMYPLIYQTRVSLDDERKAILDHSTL